MLRLDVKYFKRFWLCFFVTVSMDLLSWTKKPISSFKTGLSLDLVDVEETLAPHVKMLRKRVIESSNNPEIEPVYLFCNKIGDSCYNLVEKISKVGFESDLLNYFKKNSKIDERRKSKRKIEIKKEALKFVELSKISQIMEDKHHNLYIVNDTLRKDSLKKNALISEISPFLFVSKVEEIYDKIMTSDYLVVDDLLLPSFPQRVIKQFTVYRGPNCFQAALAFQNSLFARSYYYNIKEEKDHHRIMINHDELYKILVENFYEIDPLQTKLAYGDIIVFLEKPKGSQSDFQYDWIKHAAVYLFNNYTFSKGSKSPNTPYSIKTLAREWRVWSRQLDNIVTKVFRKPFKHVKKKPAMDLIDWMY